MARFNALYILLDFRAVELHESIPEAPHPVFVFREGEEKKISKY